tara:strand:+ start:87 stop:302 length:216 start_codon:yes stop_codon:yes gene_type:complete
MEGEKDIETFGSIWGWYGTIVFLAGEDIKNLEEITKMPLYYVFNFLTYMKELNRERDKEMKKMMNTNGTIL